VLAFDPPPDGGYPGRNTAEGEDALLNLTRGNSNTAVGYHALTNLTLGSYNTAVGLQALQNTKNSNLNTAVGINALSSNFTGSTNVAIGADALFTNQSGGGNTAVGYVALFLNTSGFSNTAVGDTALHNNTEGTYNTAIGDNAMVGNTTGDGNTATGGSALLSIGVGNNNSAYGFLALNKNNGGSTNIAIGYKAGFNLTTGSDNIIIANEGVTDESDTIRIGTQGTQAATYIAGISGATVASGVGVVIDTTGHLGTVTSSARYKEAIRPMGDASDTILALQPVSFHYKKELDPHAIPQFGLVPEDVEKVNPDLVAHDVEGKPYSVRYEAVNAMLLNEFLKEHQEVVALKEEVRRLSAAVKEQARKSER
jgi:hypothetical protein